MRGVRSVAALALSLALYCPSAFVQARPAQSSPAQARPSIHDLAPVVVSDGQPGPDLWKVVAEDGHVLWVLGYVQPLPTGMDWPAGRVEAIIAHAGLVLDAPSLHVGADVGFFRGLALMPAAAGMRRNPDDAELEDLLSAATYGRWREQKENYLGWEWGIERWRPGFAADKLYAAALEHHGLGGGAIGPVVQAAAGRAGLEVTPVEFWVRIDEPRALIEAFSRIHLDDVDCMERTLDRLEHGMAAAVERADAWATGDLDAPRMLEGGRSSCLKEALRSDFARQHGFDGVGRKIRELWLDTAERALGEHAVSFALLPMGEVLADDGYLSDLAGRGYRIEAPDGAALSVEAASAPTRPDPVEAPAAAGRG